MKSSPRILLVGTAASAVAALLCAMPVLAGSLNVTNGAKYVGSYGLEVVVSDQNPTYVQDNTPADEARYRTRFYVRSDHATMAAGDEFELFTAYATDDTPVLRLTVSFDGTDHRLRFVAREDGGGDTTPGAGLVLAAGWRAVEIDWQASSAPGANDGFLDLWLEGHPQTGLSGLDNDTLSVDHVRWGAVNAIDAGTGGSLYLDAFESRRTGYIGLDPVFTDVPDGYLFQNHILAIYNSGVTAGCGAGLYCPEASTNRAQMAVFLLKAKLGTDYRPDPCVGIFSDVPCPGGFAVNWIEDLYNRGITAGCGPGLYCPNATTTRSQMAVFLLKASLGTGYTPPSCTGIFDDVPCPGGFAVNWIEDLYNRGITSGCGATTYCPTNPVSRGQMAVFLAKSFSLPIPLY